MKKILLLLFGFVSVATLSYAAGFPEYYYQISSSDKQKKEFIQILKPLIQKNNTKILAERAFVENFFNEATQKAFRKTPKDQLHGLNRLAQKYRVKKLFNKKEYLKRIDAIPMALALAQAAIESGWGKSRFVREANNLFGHWTWGEKGLIPEQRDEEKNHKIRIFDSLEASVAAYALNLNRNSAYKDFRDMRYKKRRQGERLSGYEAAQSMLYYSQKREEYIQMLEQIMRNNDLSKHDRIYK